MTQPIRKELPADHQSKRGTPLMAGAVLAVGVVLTLLTASSPVTGLLAAAYVLFALIGFLDDFTKAHWQDPHGVSSRLKLGLQFICVGVLLYAAASLGILTPSIRIVHGASLMISPILFILLAGIFVVGSANAINFTDGLDGLLCVVAVPTYLFFFFTAHHADVRIFSIPMAASLAALLIYNVFPARAFMGDTGSLAIGGTLSMLAIIERDEIVIPLLFIVYFAEQLSVILQVLYYKRTHRRLFRMSPVHYHFSIQYGLTEKQIVFAFGTVSLLAAAAGVLYVQAVMR